LEPTGVGFEELAVENATLTPIAMFHIVARERAWMFNPSGGQVIWDEATGGAAAGGRAAGDSTFAVVQLTDSNGKSIILARGDHLRVKGLREHYHAEEKAINTLKQTFGDDKKFPGGKMTVVVDQVPCPPEKHDCRGKLKAYAAQHELSLEVWLPRRSAMRGTATVRPKTATSTSMRTGYPDVELVLWDFEGE